MPIVIDGSAGTVTGISAGGLPDNSITNAEMADDAIGLAELSATGTASSSTFLCGNNSWATAGGGGASNLAFDSGYGIDFSATSDGSGTDTSELLDDYEEGTWTPVHNFGGGSTGIGYSQQGGFYIKIGRKVFASFVTSINNLGSDTGGAGVSGLPYTAHNESLDRIQGGFSFFGSMQGTLNGPLFSYGMGNTTEFGFYAQNNSGGSVSQLSQIDNTNFSTSSHFRGWVHYIAA